MKRELRLTEKCPVYLTGPIHKIDLPPKTRKKRDYIIISDTTIKMTLKTFAAVSINLDDFTVKISLRENLIIAEGLWQA